VILTPLVFPGQGCHGRDRGVRKLTGENLEVVWAKFSNFKLGCLVVYAIAQRMQARPSLELKARPRFCPVRLSLSM
jgi:hypothetical protein